MYKIIAIDFDGTLLNDKKKVTYKTKKILKKCKQKKYLIVALTARNLSSVKSVTSIKLFDYLLLNNGTYLYDVNKNIGKNNSILEKYEYINIINDLKEVAKQILIISSNNYYIYKGEKQNKLSFVKKIDKLEQIQEPINRMNIVLTNQEKINYYNNLIRNKYKNVNCFIMQDSNSSLKRLSINPKGVNKASALENLGKDLNIKLEEMIFFGDGLNDLEVMEKVGCSVAMENALEEVKNKAKFITKSNNDNGVAIYLEKILNTTK